MIWQLWARVRSDGHLRASTRHRLSLTAGMGAFAKVRLTQASALPAYLKKHVAPEVLKDDERPETRLINSTNDGFLERTAIADAESFDGMKHAGITYVPSSVNCDGRARSRNGGSRMLQ